MKPARQSSVIQLLRHMCLTRHEHKESMSSDLNPPLQVIGTSPTQRGYLDCTSCPSGARLVMMSDQTSKGGTVSGWCNNVQETLDSSIQATDSETGAVSSINSGKYGTCVDIGGSVGTGTSAVSGGGRQNWCTACSAGYILEVSKLACQRDSSILLAFTCSLA